MQSLELIILVIISTFNSLKKLNYLIEVLFKSIKAFSLSASCNEYFKKKKNFNKHKKLMIIYVDREKRFSYFV